MLVVAQVLLFNLSGLTASFALEVNYPLATSAGVLFIPCAVVLLHDCHYTVLISAI